MFKYIRHAQSINVPIWLTGIIFRIIDLLINVDTYYRKLYIVHNEPTRSLRVWLLRPATINLSIVNYWSRRKKLLIQIGSLNFLLFKIYYLYNMYVPTTCIFNNRLNVYVMNRCWIIWNETRNLLIWLLWKKCILQPKSNHIHKSLTRWSFDFKFINVSLSKYIYKFTKIVLQHSYKLCKRRITLQ